MTETATAALLDDYGTANAHDLDITFAREGVGDVQVHYRKHHIGIVQSDPTLGLVFVAYTDFSEDDLDGTAGDDWEDLVRAITLEIDCVRDLLDMRVENGWLD